MKTGRVLQPLAVCTQWTDPAKIIPSVEMMNVKTEIHVDEFKKRDR
jgi:hypothetical protein